MHLHVIIYEKKRSLWNKGHTIHNFFEVNWVYVNLPRHIKTVVQVKSGNPMHDDFLTSNLRIYKLFYLFPSYSTRISRKFSSPFLFSPSWTPFHCLQPVFSSSVLAEMMRPDGSSTISVLSGENLSAELAHELMAIQVTIEEVHI